MFRTVIVALALLMALSVTTALAQQYELRGISISCGGNTVATSANFRVGLTSGQTVAGSAESPNFRAFFGLWKPQTGLSLIVAEDEYAALPERFYLGQNYPNPFNPSTTIEFALSSAEWVQLAIYNSLGQRITTLVDQPLGVGTYQVKWDGFDQRGGKVASGIYHYRLEAGDYALSKKMLLLK